MDCRRSVARSWVAMAALTHGPMVSSIKSIRIPIISQVGAELDIFANELSFDGQFGDTAEFIAAFSRLIAMRKSAAKFGFEVHCSHCLLEIEPVPGVSMYEAINRLSKDKKRNAMIWLTSGSSFLEECCHRDPGDYLECRGDVVTDSAVGVAAFRKLHGRDSGLISATTLNWDYDPVIVTWRRASEELDDPTVELSNWRDNESLERALRRLASPAQSWNDLKLKSITRFERLSFAEDSFDSLINGTPFVDSAAKRILVLFDILDQFAGAFNDQGKLTPEGQKLYKDYFTGDQAYFSDSSRTEKRNFRRELTFPHPADRNTRQQFTWHGKINHPVMRFHFSWPVRHGAPVYIVYVGPKLTKT